MAGVSLPVRARHVTVEWGRPSILATTAVVSNLLLIELIFSTMTKVVQLIFSYSAKLGS